MEGATEPESKPKPSSVDWEVELEPEPPVEVAPLTWPWWLSRASSARARKTAALATTAVLFAPAARRRAASILEPEPVIGRAPQRLTSRPSGPLRSQMADAAACSAGVGGTVVGSGVRGSGCLVVAAFTLIGGLLSVEVEPPGDQRGLRAS